MKKFFVSLFIILLCFSCNTSKRNKANIYQLIPDSTQVVIKINTLETFKSDINNSAFVKAITKTNFYENFNTSLERLGDFKTDNELLICFNNYNDTTYFTFITKHHDSLVKTSDSLKLHNTIIDSIHVASSSKNIIDAIKVNKNNSFNNYNKVLDEKASFSILLNRQSARSFGNTIFNPSNKEFASSLVLDLEVSPDQFIFNGVSINNDSIKNFVDIFKNTVPQENTIQNIAPINSNGFVSLTYNDFQVLNKNLLSLKQQAVDSTQHFELLETLKEVGIIYFEGNEALVLKSIDAFSTTAF